MASTGGRPVGWRQGCGIGYKEFRAAQAAGVDPMAAFHRSEYYYAYVLMTLYVSCHDIAAVWVVLF